MDTNKRLEKILLQLEHLQKPLNRLSRHLNALQSEPVSEAVFAGKLERELQHFEQEMMAFREEILLGYGQIAPGRAALMKRFRSSCK